MDLFKTDSYYSELIMCLCLDFENDWIYFIGANRTPYQSQQ